MLQVSCVGMHSVMRRHDRGLRLRAQKGGVMHREKRGTEDLKSGKYTLVSEEEDTQNQAVFLHAPRKRDVASGLGGWFIAWQEASMILAGDKRLNLTDHRVLLVLQAKLDFENWLRLSLTDIGDPIGIARQNISISMKKLIEMNVVLTGPSVKNVRTYRLNPAIVWKGDLRQGATERRRALRVINGGNPGSPVEPSVSIEPNQYPLF